jgi:hypothetical protein
MSRKEERMIRALLNTEVMKQRVGVSALKNESSIEDLLESDDVYLRTLALIVRRINSRVSAKKIYEELATQMKVQKV